MLNFILGFIVGAVFLFITINSIVKRAVSVSISEDTFNKALKICKEHGGLLVKIVAYYHEDIFYCDNMTIIATKDKGQGMWIKFEVIKPETVIRGKDD